MRTKFETVDDPKIINAQLLEFRPPNKDIPRERHQERVLRIRITTDKIKVGNMLDPNKLKEGVPIDVLNKKSYMSFQRKPHYINLKLIRCKKNKKTRYKDFLYLLRNPHAALLYVNSDIEELKTLAMKIIQGYRIIFPREVRYYGAIQFKTSDKTYSQ